MSTNTRRSQTALWNLPICKPPDPRISTFFLRLKSGEDVLLGFTSGCPLTPVLVSMDMAELAGRSAASGRGQPNNGVTH